MSKIHLHIRENMGWQSSGGVHIRGSAFWKGEGADLAPLPDAFAGVQSAADFVALLQRLNGFFAVIRENGDEVYAAVDHTRSIPLFYGQKGDDAYISDDAHWVREHVGDEAFEELAETEFSLCGYVTGPDTLHAHVKQLQAGEAVIIEAGPNGTDLRPKRYYRRIHGHAIEAGLDELATQHEQVMEQSTQRMMKWADGRCLCIPLSNGRDSRLIALMLRQLGCKNVLTFSYGKPGNAESEGSRRVARRLGFRWEFVPYSLESWHKWFHSPERRDYWRMADGLSSMPHCQDWPAVWEMKKAGVLPPETVFVPGHAGTLRIRAPHFFRTAKGKPAEARLVHHILKHNYRWESQNPRIGDLEHRLYRRILDRCEASNVQTFLDMESAAAKWSWQERNAKFAVNSVRVYEYWGYRWWLPLMDRELVDFWSRVPAQFRTFRLGHKLFYEAHADQMWARYTSGENKPVKTRIGGVRWPLHQLAVEARINQWLRRVIHLLKRVGEYDRHPMALYGAIPRAVFSRLYTGSEDVNWFFTQERLGQVSFDEGRQPSGSLDSGTACGTQDH